MKGKATPGRALDRSRLRALLVERLGPKHDHLANHLVSLGVLVWREAHAEIRAVDSKARRRDADLFRRAAMTARTYADEMPFPLRNSEPSIVEQLTILAASIEEDVRPRGGQDSPSLGLLINGVATSCRHHRLPVHVTENGPADAILQVLAPLATKGAVRPDWRTRRGYLERVKRVQAELSGGE